MDKFISYEQAAQERPIVGYEGGRPLVPAIEDDYGYLKVWCLTCRRTPRSRKPGRWHHHGRGYGHRVSHCTDPGPLRGDYVLVPQRVLLEGS